MTFNPAIPLNSDSPGIFPAQSQANFTRLQTIMSSDHQFNLTAAANDGWHTLIHLIPQAPSGILANTGRAYVKSTGGLIQFFYMDDAGTEYQLTPQSVTEVSKIIGTAFLASNGTISVLNASYDYTGYGVVYINGTNVQRSYNFTKSGSVVYLHEFDSNSGSPSRPTLFYSGTNLLAKNNDSSGQNIVWSLMVNRIF